MAVGLLLEQGPGGLQRLNDLGVGILEHIQARERPGFVGEVAGFVHRAEHRQAVLLAGVEVVDAVTRRGVHEACARFGGDVIAPDHHRTGAVQERVAVRQTGEQGAFHRGATAQRELQGAAQRLDQIGSHKQQSAFAVVDQGVVEPFIDRHRQVGWQRPGGGCPDRHLQGLPQGVRLGGQVEAFCLECILQCCRQLHGWEGGVDAGTGVAVGVLQFGFGQSCA